MALVDAYDAVIFDYGGVLVTHQTAEDQAAMARIAQLDPARFTELYWATRADYDSAVLTAEEYWNGIAAAAGRSLTPDQVLALSDADAESWMHFDPPVWEWVEQLRGRGKKTAVLSNMPRELGEALKAKTDRLRGFDEVTLSYEVHSAKPEAAIYEHCLEGLGTAAERTLFLDDRMENVQAAEVLGIRALQFLDRDSALLQLRA